MRAYLHTGSLSLAVLALLACSSDYGDSGTTTPAGGDGGTSSSSSSSSGGDAGRDAGAARPVSRPNKIECGTDQVCDSPMICCITQKNQACTTEADCKENKVKCDERADCAAGSLCCASVTFSTFETSCAAGSCSIGQACRSDEECGNQKCIKQECFGLTGWECGKNAFCKEVP